MIKELPLLLSALFAAGCATKPNPPPAPRGDLPIPVDLRAQAERASDIGRQLHLLDKIAAIGSDVVRRNVKDLRGTNLGGYLPFRIADAQGQPSSTFLVIFFTAETPPRIVYQVRIEPNVIPTFEAFDPPRPGSEQLTTLVLARRLALAAVPPSGQPRNPVILPGAVNDEDGILVYLIASTTRPHVAVLGKHFRALISADGKSVSYLKPLAKSVLEVPTRGPNGEKVAALTTSHLLTDVPSETHVLCSLMTKLPVYVTTRRGVWRVDGHEIALVDDKVPARDDDRPRAGR